MNVMRVRDKSVRDNLPSPPIGLLIFRGDTCKVEMYVGCDQPDSPADGWEVLDDREASEQ